LQWRPEESASERATPSQFHGFTVNRGDLCSGTFRTNPHQRTGQISEYQDAGNTPTKKQGWTGRSTRQPARRPALPVLAVTSNRTIK
jgi:hypothetical protein